MFTILKCLYHSRILLKSLTYCVYRHWHVVGFESVQHSPDAYSTAILKIALGVKRSLTRSWKSIRLLCQSVFGLPVSILDILLGSFFVVDYEGYCDLGVVRPLCLRWMSTISDES